MQIKPGWDSISDPSEWQRLTNLKISRVDQDVGKWEFLYIAGGGMNCFSHVEAIWQHVVQPNMHVHCDLATALWAILEFPERILGTKHKKDTRILG